MGYVLRQVLGQFKTVIGLFMLHDAVNLDSICSDGVMSRLHLIIEWEFDALVFIELLLRTDALRREVLLLQWRGALLCSAVFLALLALEGDGVALG